MYQTTIKQYPIVEMSEFFANLPHRDCNHVLAAARPKDFATRDVLFVAGEPAKEVFLLASGRVRITQFGRNGEEVILRLELPGELIGEIARIPEGTHSSAAQADQDCRTLAWDSPTFKAATMRFPILQRNLQRIVEQRILELEQRLCEISTANISVRVAHTLLRLLDRIGGKLDHRHQIDIEQEEVAKMTGTTVGALNRLLANWEKQGLVSQERGSIIVRSYKGLPRLSKATSTANTPGS